MIEIPKRMRQRPRQAGLPIPYVNMTGPQGADFRTLDGAARLECAARNLCGLCGQPLKGTVVLIGSEEDLAIRRWFDPPMHEECALYAVKACPFLANADRDYSKMQPKYLPEGEEVDQTFAESTEAAAFLCVVWTPGCHVVSHRGTGFWTVNQITKVDRDLIPRRARHVEEAVAEGKGGQEGCEGRGRGAGPGGVA